MSTTTNERCDVNEKTKTKGRPGTGGRQLWKRATLIALLAILLWLMFYLRAKPTPKVIHASRYSKEFRYRPAASPVITEYLKDGQTRLRGAIPTR